MYYINDNGKNYSLNFSNYSKYFNDASSGEFDVIPVSTSGELVDDDDLKNALLAVDEKNYPFPTEYYIIAKKSFSGGLLYKDIPFRFYANRIRGELKIKIESYYRPSTNFGNQTLSETTRSILTLENTTDVHLKLEFARVYSSISSDDSYQYKLLDSSGNETTNLAKNIIINPHSTLKISITGLITYDSGVGYSVRKMGGPTYLKIYPEYGSLNTFNIQINHGSTTTTPEALQNNLFGATIKYIDEKSYEYLGNNKYYFKI